MTLFNIAISFLHAIFVIKKRLTATEPTMADSSFVDSAAGKMSQRCCRSEGEGDSPRQLRYHRHFHSIVVAAVAFVVVAAAWQRHMRVRTRQNTLPAAADAASVVPATIAEQQNAAPTSYSLLPRDDRRGKEWSRTAGKEAPRPAAAAVVVATVVAAAAGIAMVQKMLFDCHHLEH